MKVDKNLKEKRNNSAIQNLNKKELNQNYNSMLGNFYRYR